MWSPADAQKALIMLQNQQFHGCIFFGNKLQCLWSKWICHILKSFHWTSGSLGCWWGWATQPSYQNKNNEMGHGLLFSLNLTRKCHNWVLLCLSSYFVRYTSLSDARKFVKTLRLRRRVLTNFLASLRLVYLTKHEEA